MVRIFGHNDLAEKYLGRGGSYLFWKILGIICIIIAVLFLVGSLDSIFNFNNNIAPQLETQIP